MKKTNFKFYISYFLIWLIIFPVFNYNVFLWNAENTTKNNSSTTTYKVEVWDITNSIETTWDASLVDEQSLEFTKDWTITKVNFSEWDEVKKGDIIAEIDNSDGYTSIKEAEISLQNSKINLSQLYEEEDESKITSAKNSITNTEKSITIAKQELENLKISQENSLTKLQENLEIEKKNLETMQTDLSLAKQELETLKKEKEDSFDTTTNNKNSSITDVENDFKSYLTTASTIIENSDVILGVSEDNKDKNDTYEDYLWAKNSSIKSEAKASLLSSIWLYENLEEELKNYSYSWDETKVKNILTKFKELYDNLYETANLTYKTADSSISSLGTLSDSEIDSMKKSMDSDRNSALSKVSSIKNSLNKLENLTDTDLVSESNKNSIASKEKSISSQEISIEKQENSITNLEKSYKETVEDYNLKIESKENSIKKEEDSLEVSKLNLKELLEWPTEENVAKAKNSVTQAELKLKSAKENLDDYVLKAPFDGIISKIDYMVWDNIDNDTDKYVYIENPNLLEITVMLDQIDIVKVQKWDKAIVTFDAYSDDPVDAVISNINTNPSKSSGVVSYEVKIVLNDEDFDETILSGFTADVEIINEQKDDVLLLKTSAIQEKNGKKYVNLIKDWKTEKTYIETWLSSDGMSEITSGLSQWDSVQVENFTTTAKEDSKSVSLFGWWWNSRWPGSWWWMWPWR